jgi:hypothetical protein
VWSPIHVSANVSERKGLSEKEAHAYANEKNTWVICYQQGIRTSNFYQYDATDSCLYFSYFKPGCVDVYDTQGVFLYSIIFPERQNGGVLIRCENNLTYIRTKDNILYVFSGTEEVQHMYYDTAKEKGYDSFWFRDNTPHVTVDSKWICWLDETGSVNKQIPTPSVIRETVPLPSGAEIALPIIAVLVILLSFFFKGITLITSKFSRLK